jgi:outer membrane lipoprotein-sorting protein
MIDDDEMVPAGKVKVFFFEKKKQKTFAHCGRHIAQRGNAKARHIRKSFLVLFFKKEHPSFLPAAIMLAATLPGGCGTRAPVLTADDRGALAQVQTYLDGLRQFHAQFSETGSNGAADGVLWIARPGRLRVEYIHPGEKLLLANHGRLLLSDPATGATTTMPVAKTPLDILLADKITLTGPVTVTGVQHAQGALGISLVKTGAAGQGTLTLQFNTLPLALRGVVVQDASGHTDAYSLYGLFEDSTVDPNLFHYRPPPPG